MVATNYQLFLAPLEGKIQTLPAINFKKKKWSLLLKFLFFLMEFFQFPFF